MRSTIRRDGEGELMWFAGGGAITWKLSGADTDGACFLFEDRMERGKTTPLHTHPHGELLLLLEGEMLVHVDGEEHALGAGDVAWLAPGERHALLVTSEHARLLSVQASEAGERFFRDAGEPARTPEEAARPADIARLQRVAAASPSIEVFGPPPFASVVPA